MKKILMVSMLAMMVLIPLSVLAQGVGVDVPVIEAVVPSADNPLPVGEFDLIDSVMVLISTFQSAWFLGVALCLFLAVNVLRGKLKIGNWVVKIPKFSDWLDGTGKKFKSYFIIGLTGLGMAFAALKLVEVWGTLEVAKAMLGGFLGGVQLALAALGVNSVVTNHKPEETTPVEPTK